MKPQQPFFIEKVLIPADSCLEDRADLILLTAHKGLFFYGGKL